MTRPIGQCPADPAEIAESYWMGRLPPSGALEFSLHCETCPRCARESLEAREFIRLVRAALAEPPPPAFIHRFPKLVIGKPRNASTWRYLRILRTWPGVTPLQS